MKKPFFCMAVLCAILTLPQIQAHAQFFKKLKDKVNQAIGTPAASTPATTSTSTSNSSSSPVNKTGAGLSNTAPPDIMQGINDAEKENSAADYSSARYSLQQALIGVEIQLGKQLLQSLPASVDGLNKDTTKNVVASTQYGWGNLTILTVYSDGKNKQMTITIGNNPAYAGIVSLYFNNAAAVQSNGNNNPNMKQTRVKGNQAVIQFDKSSGYSMFMQLGQSSMIVWTFVNFATEDEVMSAANSFDIDGIKKTMGEQ